MHLRLSRGFRSSGAYVALALLFCAGACHREAGPPVGPPSPSPSPIRTDPSPAPDPTPAPVPKPSFELDGNRLVLPGPIVFSGAGATLDETASLHALEYLHDFLAARSDVTLLRIEGHGDVPGKDALMASGEQALLVGRWLVAHGIACQRLIAAAFGDTKPVADTSTAEGRARNRRIEAVSAELRGHAIGGMPKDGSAPAAAPVCD